MFSFVRHLEAPFVQLIFVKIADIMDCANF